MQCFNVKLFLLASLLGVLLAGHAQNKSSDANDTLTLKRGFYKDYNEYLNNSPSIFRDFSVQFIPRDEFDSTIIGATCTLADSAEKLPVTWGFSDGQYPYVTIYVKNKPTYWRLAFRGRNPYFYFTHKSAYVPGPSLLISIVNAIVTANAPLEVDLGFINTIGQPTYASYGQLKELFSSKPALLKSFKSEKNISTKQKKQYLLRYNSE